MPLPPGVFSPERSNGAAWRLRRPQLSFHFRGRQAPVRPTSPRDMAFLESGSIKLYYEIHGDMGPFIVLTHGFSATSQMWRGQIDVLSRDHRLVLWDMRGHGRSDYPDDPSEYSEKATVEDIAALLGAVGTKKAIVGGLSLEATCLWPSTRPIRIGSQRSSSSIPDPGSGTTKQERLGTRTPSRQHPSWKPRAFRF